MASELTRIWEWCVVRSGCFTYQYPEEEWELKRVLEEDEVDEVQDDPRPPEPEVLVWWLHDQIALDRRVPRGYIVG